MFASVFPYGQVVGIPCLATDWFGVGCVVFAVWSDLREHWRSSSLMVTLSPALTVIATTVTGPAINYTNKCLYWFAFLLWEYGSIRLILTEHRS